MEIALGILVALTVFLFFLVVATTNLKKEPFQMKALPEAEQAVLNFNFGDDEEEEALQKEHYKGDKLITPVKRHAKPSIVLSLHVIVAKMCGQRALSALDTEQIKDLICPRPRKQANKDNDSLALYQKSLAGYIRRKSYGYVKLPYKNVEITIDDSLDLTDVFKATCGQCLDLRNNEAVMAAFQTVEQKVNLKTCANVMLLLPQSCVVDAFVLNYRFAPDMRAIVTTTPALMSMPNALHEIYHHLGLGHSNRYQLEYEDPTCIMGLTSVSEGFLNAAHSHFLGISTPIQNGNVDLVRIIKNNETFVRQFKLPRMWRSYENHVVLRIGMFRNYYISYTGLGYSPTKKARIAEQLAATFGGVIPKDLPSKMIGICVHEKYNVKHTVSNIVAFLPVIFEGGIGSPMTNTCFELIDPGFLKTYLYITINAFDKNEATITIEFKNTSDNCVPAIKI
jgi:hypothetical protein